MTLEPVHRENGLPGGLPRRVSQGRPPGGRSRVRSDTRPPGSGLAVRTSELLSRACASRVRSPGVRILSVPFAPCGRDRFLVSQKPNPRTHRGGSSRPLSGGGALPRPACSVPVRHGSAHPMRITPRFSRAKSISRGALPGGRHEGREGATPHPVRGVVCPRSGVSPVCGCGVRLPGVHSPNRPETRGRVRAAPRPIRAPRQRRTFASPSPCGATCDAWTSAAVTSSQGRLRARPRRRSDELEFVTRARLFDSGGERGDPGGEGLPGAGQDQSPPGCGLVRDGGSAGPGAGQPTTARPRPDPDPSGALSRRCRCRAAPVSGHSCAPGQGS